MPSLVRGCFLLEALTSGPPASSVLCPFLLVHLFLDPDAIRWIYIILTLLLQVAVTANLSHVSHVSLCVRVVQAVTQRLSRICLVLALFCNIKLTSLPT